MKASDFDKRIVTYEYIHSIKNEDWNALYDALKLEDNNKVLDFGCGYGSVTKEICNRLEFTNVEFYLIDNSNVQITGAKKNLSAFSDFKIAFSNEDVTKMTFKDDFFDVVVAKMSFHELGLQKLKCALLEIRRCLKKGGRLIIWDIFPSEQNKAFISKVIGKKNLLAGYYLLAKNRYFLTENELFELLRQTNFVKFEKTRNIDYSLETQKRLFAEFNADFTKLQEWTRYITDEIEQVDNEVTGLSYKIFTLLRN